MADGARRNRCERPVDRNGLMGGEGSAGPAVYPRKRSEPGLVALHRAVFRPHPQSSGFFPLRLGRLAMACAVHKCRLSLCSPQACSNLYIVDFIARTSCHEVPGCGWTWNHDPAAVGRYRFEDVWSALGEVTCPAAFVRGAHRVLTANPGFEAALRPASSGTRSATIVDACRPSWWISRWTYGDLARFSR